jgi:hypothetical protein
MILPTIISGLPSSPKVSENGLSLSGIYRWYRYSSKDGITSVSPTIRTYASLSLSGLGFLKAGESLLLHAPEGDML